MSVNAKMLAGAAGAGLAVWLIDRAMEPSRTSTDIPATKAKGFNQGLDQFSHLPCKVPRLGRGETTTLTGGPIRTRKDGIGEDFLREFYVQRQTLTRAMGDLGLIEGFTTRPALSAKCAEEWLELWLDASDTLPRSYWPLHKGDAQPSSWRKPVSVLEGHAGYTELGKRWNRLRALHAQAHVLAQLPFIGAAQPWIGARTTYEAIRDFASELDRVGYRHGDAQAEALEQLREDLHPVKFLEKAADLALVPAEVGLSHVVGPALALLLSTVVSVVLPYVVLGGAIYYVVRKQRAG